MKKLYRSKFNKMASGVCGGLGNYLKIDPTIIRLIVIFVCAITGFFPLLIAYIIATLIIPVEKQNYPIKHNYKKLYRSRTDRKIAGICGGIGESTKLDPVFLRLMLLFLCIITFVFPFILAYIVGWIIIPEKPVEHINYDSTDKKEEK